MIILITDFSSSMKAENALFSHELITYITSPVSDRYLCESSNKNC